MRNAEAFKVGFCKYMAAHGLLPSDFEDALTKSAGPLSFLTDWMPGVGPGIGTATNLGLAVGLGAPLVLGSGLGYMGRKALQAEDPTLDEVKGDEMTSLYRQLAREVRERTAIQASKQPKKERTFLDPQTEHSA